MQVCLEELRARHYLDDERYARQFVGAHARRGQGPLRIRQELSTLGLGDEAVQQALDEHGAWTDDAREVRARRFGPQLPGNWAERAKQSRFLQYRGFSNDDIRLVMGTDVSADS